MITDAEVENWFSYHSPNQDQMKKYVEIRGAAKILAYLIIQNTPASADQSAAIRLLRECVMTANAAIACG